MEQININDFEGVFEIMDQSFPQDERRKKEEQRALFSVPEYKVFVRREGGKIIAFIAVWEFERFLYVEHFAVSPKKRGGGWDSCRRSLQCDASIHPSFGNERQKQESPGKNVICDA